MATASAGQILAEAKAASGGASLDAVHTFDINSTVKEGGLTGQQEEWDDVVGGRYSVSFQLGPTSGSQGYDGKKPWLADQSGMVTFPADADSIQSAVTSAYLESMSYWFLDRMPGTTSYLKHATEKGRDFDVLQISPKGGYPAQMWIDSATHLIDRTVEVGAEETQTTYYSDYHTVAGVQQAFTVRETNGKPKYDTITKIDSIDVNSPVPALQFDAPKPKGLKFEIGGGGSSVTVPFQYKEDHIYLPIKINGHSYSAVFDTGGAYVMTPHIAKQLAVKPQGAAEATGGGEGSVDTGFVKVGTVQIGGLTVHQPMFVVMPIPMLASNPIIGFEILNQFVVEVDYDRHTLTFTIPDQYSYAGKGIILPFRLNHTIPEVDGSLDGIHGAFTIDTGAGYSLALASLFVTKNNLTSKYHPKFNAIAGYGVGGPVHAGVSRANTLMLGGATINDPVTFLTSAKAGAESNKIVAGNIGEGVIHRFNVTFDYSRQRIILEPNSNFGERDIYNRTGMIFDWRDTRALVSDVIPGSPAANAGIKVGDIVLRLNGIPTSYGGMWSASRGPIGSKQTLVVQSGKSNRTVTVTLKDLI